MFFLKPLRYAAKALAAQDRPEQLAAGFALGALAGLIPKTSLLAHVLLVVLSLIQVNLAAGYLAVLLFSAIAGIFDPLTHAIGSFLLESAALRGLFTGLYNMPVIPWTEFNNTVVLGSFALGCAAFFPLYKAMIPAWKRYQAAFGERFRKFKVVQLLLGAELAGKLKGE